MLTRHGAYCHHARTQAGIPQCSDASSSLRNDPGRASCPSAAVKELARLRLCPAEPLIADHLEEVLKHYPDFEQMREFLNEIKTAIAKTQKPRDRRKTSPNRPISTDKNPPGKDQIGQRGKQ